MRRRFKFATVLTAPCLFALLALPGCGGVEPDQPAELSADQEQEILQQVEGASAAEQSQQTP